MSLSFRASYKKLALLCLGLMVYGCTSQFGSMRSDKQESALALDEMRIELADVKHALHTYQVEMKILEDKLKLQQNSVSSIKNDSLKKQQPKLSEFSLQLAALEKKIEHLEKTQEKAIADLRQLSSHANQTSHSLTQIEQQLTSHGKRLDDVAKLKATLSSISKAVNPKNSSNAAFKKYQVKAGDSLEKVARSHQVTVDAIKKMNGLENDRISAGQEIKIPYAD
jgi:LysM repeat protein